MWENLEIGLEKASPAQLKIKPTQAQATPFHYRTSSAESKVKYTIDDNENTGGSAYK